VKCYNYDYSYSHHPSGFNAESADNFELGDIVDLKAADGTPLNANVQIVDKWTFRNSDGTKNTRFRFSEVPNLGYVKGVPSVTHFYMNKGPTRWNMITYNYKTAEGTVPSESISTITGVTNNSGYVQFSFSDNPGFTVGGDPSETSSAFSITNSQGFPVENAYFGYSVLIGDATSTTLKTKYSWGIAGPAASSALGRSIVRRNVIVLPATASTTSGFYNGYIVTLTRNDIATGKTTTQERTIIDYVGNGRVATIDGLWDYGYHPKPGDKVSLTPAYADARVSINPAMQLMDYITSTTYGRGLSPTKDLNFESWLESGRVCDQQSNVTIKLASETPPVPGSIYKYPENGPILWQGTVVGSEAGYVEFTNVIGKLTNKWVNWKSYKVGELVYKDSTLYTVTSAGVKPNEPSNGNGFATVSGVTLVKTVGEGVASLLTVGDGNPIRAIRNGTTVPGYSLYDSDGVDYWRMLGWDEFSQRYATRHQTNLIVDTSLPLLDNINSFLEHFSGILRYSSGQYYLEVEEAEGPISNEIDEPRNITTDLIIGKLRLVDEGIRGAFNSLTAAYADPANKFESRNISFFNSDYLKADRNVPKKGSLTVPGITNYYNTRLLADKTLNKSRFGLTASFNMRPLGVVLLAGKVVQLQYPRYGWKDKKFRILNLTHQDDATVDLVVEEYDDSFYGLSKISKQAASGLAGSTGSVTGLASPTNLKVSSVDDGDETTSAISLTWTNNPAANSKNVFTEIYASYSSHLYVEFDGVSGNTITTRTNPHELVEGEVITALSNVAGLQTGKTYFVKSVPSPNQLTLSETKGGPVYALVSGDYDGFFFQTANLVATLPIPTNSYVDVFGGIDNRVVKYYWIRHKVVQVT
jgi:hypothetical protein